MTVVLAPPFVRCVTLITDGCGRYWNAGYFDALYVVKKACDANGITMVQVDGMR